MDIKKYSLLGLLVASSLIPVSSQAAGALTGTLALTLTIGSGCTVTNGAVAGNPVWGTLNFGSYTDLNSPINGTVQGTAGGNVTVTCSTGLTPSIALNGGLTPSTGATPQRTLTSVAAGATPIPYRLYSDAAHTKEYVINTAQALPVIGAGNATQNIPIYGYINPTEQANKTPASGTYVDTVVATLSW